MLTSPCIFKKKVGDVLQSYILSILEIDRHSENSCTGRKIILTLLWHEASFLQEDEEVPEQWACQIIFLKNGQMIISNLGSWLLHISKDS